MLPSKAVKVADTALLLVHEHTDLVAPLKLKVCAQTEESPANRSVAESKETASALPSLEKTAPVSTGGRGGTPLDSIVSVVDSGKYSFPLLPPSFSHKTKSPLTNVVTFAVRMKLADSAVDVGSNLKDGGDTAT